MLCLSQNFSNNLGTPTWNPEPRKYFSGEEKETVLFPESFLGHDNIFNGSLDYQCIFFRRGNDRKLAGVFCHIPEWRASNGCQLLYLESQRRRFDRVLRRPTVVHLLLEPGMERQNLWIFQDCLVHLSACFVSESVVPDSEPAICGLVVVRVWNRDAREEHSRYGVFWMGAIDSHGHLVFLYPYAKTRTVFSFNDAPHVSLDVHQDFHHRQKATSSDRLPVWGYFS